jgi:hypothetical protein
MMTLSIEPRLMLPKRPVSHGDWKLWEKKNFNLHRGVIEMSIANSSRSINDIASEVRTGVKEEFRPGWLRGFAFGTILHLEEATPDFGDICNHVDTRNKLAGVWQWTIVVFDSEKVAIGIHTWLHGYLRPVYDSLLQQLQKDGYNTHSSDADIDPLFVTLRKIHKTCSVLGRIENLLN